MFIDSRTALRHLTVPLAMQAIGAALHEQGRGKTTVRAFEGNEAGTAFGIAEAVLSGVSLMATRTISDKDAHSRHVVALFSAGDGRLLATVDGTALMDIRQAATVAIAADLLSRPDAETLGIFGTGPSSRSLIEALAEVRSLENVIVAGQDPLAAAELSLWVRERFGISSRTADPREASCRADLIVAGTPSEGALISSDAIKADAFIAIAGTSRVHALDGGDPLLRHAGRIVVEYKPSNKRCFSDSSSLSGNPVNVRVEELAEIVASNAVTQHRPSITLFKTTGVGIADLALAGLVYDLSVHGEAEPFLPLDAPAPAAIAQTSPAAAKAPDPARPATCRAGRT